MSSIFPPNYHLKMEHTALYYVSNLSLIEDYVGKK